MSRIQLFRCLSLAFVFETSAYDIWHPLDIQSVICPSAPGTTTITVDLNDIATSERTVPHIFSFFRTFENSVKIYFNAVDADGKVFVNGSDTVTYGSPVKMALNLASVTLSKVPPVPSCAANSAVACPGCPAGACDDRRLATQVEELKENDLLEVEEEEPEQVEQEEELEEEEVKQDVHKDDESLSAERRLLSGRILKSSGGRSSSRAKSSSSKSSSPRPAPRPPTYTPYSKASRSKGTDAASYAGARRRANPLTARRRGNPAPLGARRRIPSPVSGIANKNPANPAAASYGYGSQSKINSNYPAGYSKTSYGFAGGKAHKGSSGKNIGMKLAGAAAVGGVMGMYVGSRWGHHGWGWRGRRCHHGGSASDCDTCYRDHSNCQSEVLSDAARDDLMSTGFMPADFFPGADVLAQLKSPANFTIYKIEGDDFTDTSGLCPPSGWTLDRRLIGVPDWTPRDPQPDMFITLGSMMELDEPLEGEYTHYGVDEAAFRGPSFALAFLLCLSLRRLW